MSRVRQAAKRGSCRRPQPRSRGLSVAAGHGLDYENVGLVAAISEVEELNIGFSIVARAVEVGFHQAVREMAMLVHGENP